MVLGEGLPSKVNIAYFSLSQQALQAKVHSQMHQYYHVKPPLKNLPINNLYLLLAEHKVLGTYSHACKLKFRCRTMEMKQRTFPSPTCTIDVESTLKSIRPCFASLTAPVISLVTEPSYIHLISQ